MADFEENVIKKVVPHSDEAEKSVLGAILIDNNCLEEIAEIVPDGSFFYNRNYGVIYDTMRELRKRGSAIDAVTLPEKLKEKDVSEQAVSDQVIANLVMSVPTSANAVYYANMVYEKATLRELIKVSEDIANQCYRGKDDVNDLLEDTEKKVFKITQRKSAGKQKQIVDVVTEALKQIEIAAKTAGEVTGLGTGFYDLDKMTTGFRPGNLVLVAARPAMGKTAFVLSIAKDVILRQRKAVAMFSLEMADTELIFRMLSMDSKVDSHKFKTGELSEGDWESIVESGGNLASTKFYLDDSSTSLSEIRSKCRKLKVEKDIQLIIIDYLQLMNNTGRGSDSRQQEISEISRGLKLLAKELGIPVIALSQLSRQVEGRTDHRPMLSDLRESGAIEQDADTVIFIYRDEVYNPDTDKKNRAEIIIAKQRSGPIGKVELAWLPEYTQFGNLAK